MIRIRSRYRHSFSTVGSNGTNFNNLIIQQRMYTRVIFGCIGIFLCVVIFYSILEAGSFTITPIVILLLLLCLYQSGKNTVMVFSQSKGVLSILHKFLGVIFRQKEFSIQSITGVTIQSVVYNTQILRRANPSINYLYLETNLENDPKITIDDSTHLPELENLAEVISEYISIPHKILSL